MDRDLQQRMVQKSSLPTTKKIGANNHSNGSKDTAVTKETKNAIS